MYKILEKLSYEDEEKYIETYHSEDIASYRYLYILHKNYRNEIADRFTTGTPSLLSANAICS